MAQPVSTYSAAAAAGSSATDTASGQTGGSSAVSGRQLHRHLGATEHRGLRRAVASGIE